MRDLGSGFVLGFRIWGSGLGARVDGFPGSELAILGSSSCKSLQQECLDSARICEPVAALFILSL